MLKFKKKVKQNRKFKIAVTTNFYFYLLRDMLNNNIYDYIME